jgi:hypothetical protein
MEQGKIVPFASYSSELKQFKFIQEIWKKKTMMMKKLRRWRILCMHSPAMKVHTTIANLMEVGIGQG